MRIRAAELDDIEVEMLPYWGEPRRFTLRQKSGKVILGQWLVFLDDWRTTGHDSPPPERIMNHLRGQRELLAATWMGLAV